MNVPQQKRKKSNKIWALNNLETRHRAFGISTFFLELTKAAFDAVKFLCFVYRRKVYHREISFVKLSPSKLFPSNFNWFASNDSRNLLSLFTIIPEISSRNVLPSRLSKLKKNRLTTHAVIDSQQFFARGSILNDVLAANSPFQLMNNESLQLASGCSASDMSYQRGKQFHLFTIFDWFSFFLSAKDLRWNLRGGDWWNCCWLLTWELYFDDFAKYFPFYFTT